MKILYVFGGEVASGAEIVIERLIRNNSQENQNSLWVSPGEFADTLMQKDIPYKVITKPYLKKLDRVNLSIIKYVLRLIWSVFRFNFNLLVNLFREKIDVVHVNSLAGAVYLLPIVLLSHLIRPKVKWFWSVHDLKYYSKIDEKMANLCLLFYDRILVVSCAVKNKYRGVRGYKKIRVLYNGLETDAFFRNKVGKDSICKQNSLPPNCIVIGMAAFIDERKGQYELIKVFNELKSSNKDIVLLLAGRILNDSDLYTKKVIKLVQESENVIYMGQIQDMLEFYNTCDIIVNNSNAIGSEPLGTSIYEAMACERIVVASNTGGTPEIIDDNKDGFLFEPGSGDDLFKVLTKAINVVNDSNEITKSARGKVLNKFSIDRMVRQYNMLLSEVSN